jgi:FSR family fosmidomycin resistance protein-like MFS transporter
MSLSLSQQGFLAFIFTASTTWMQPVIGYMVDRHGKTWLLTASVIWIAFWVSISGVIGNYYILTIVLILGGTASALYHPLGSATAIKLTSRQAGTSLSIFMTVGGIASAVAPSVAIPLATNFGLGSLIYLFIPGIVTALIMYKTRVQAISLNGKTEKTPDTPKNTPIHAKVLFPVLLLLLVSALRGWLKVSLVAYGAQLFMIKSISVEAFSVLLSIQLFTGSFGNLVGGFLSDIIGSKRVLLYTILLMTICLGMLLQFGGIIAMTAFMLIGILISASNAANILMTRDFLPQNATMATGLILGLGAGIGGLGVMLQGHIADISGMSVSFIYLLVSVAVSFILVAFLPQPESSGKRSVQH